MGTAAKTSVEFLKAYKDSFNKELDSLFDSGKLASSNPLLNAIQKEKKQFPDTELLDSIKYSLVDGGKRLRPILSLLTAEAILKQEEQLNLNSNPALGLALAIELIHTGSLIHDDLPCMDDDDLRRGRASNHIKFNEATSLLAGDFLMTYPIEILINKSPNIAAEKVQQAVLKLNQAISSMIVGQAMDMNLGKNASQNLEELQTMQSLKTGALLTASTEIAAILSGANETQVEALRKYAQNIGLAFQIADDVLDATASQEELGKTPGKDQEQNKLTYVNQYGVDKAKKIAQNLIKEAQKSIDSIGIYPDKLISVADYVISRTH